MPSTSGPPSAVEIATLTTDVLLMLGSCAALVEHARDADAALKRSKWTRKPKPVRKGAGDGRWASSAAEIAGYATAAVVPAAIGAMPTAPRRWFKVAHDFATQVADWDARARDVSRRVELASDAFRRAAAEIPVHSSLGEAASAHEAAVGFCLRVWSCIYYAVVKARRALATPGERDGTAIGMEQYVRFAPEIASALLTESPKPPAGLRGAIERESAIARVMIGRTDEAKTKTPDARQGPFAESLFQWGASGIVHVPLDQWTILKKLFVGERPRDEPTHPRELYVVAKGRGAKDRAGALRSKVNRLNTLLIKKKLGTVRCIRGVGYYYQPQNGTSLDSVA